MDDSSIDTSQWLKRDASVVNVHRVNKGDLDLTILDGRIAAAHVADQSIVSELIARGVLDDHHHYYAMTLLDLRRYFRRAVGYKGNAIYAREFLSVSNSGILETIYLRVCRLIGRQHERVITFCLEEPATDANVRSIITGKHDCRTAFDALVRSIDEARKDIEE